MYAMWAQMADAMAPAMLAMAAGSMLANLARRSFGEYDLPIPRPPQDELVLVSPNLAAFGDEWSLAADDLRLWVCLHEVAHHTILGVPHIGDELARHPRRARRRVHPRRPRPLRARWATCASTTRPRWRRSRRPSPTPRSSSGPCAATPSVRSSPGSRRSPPPSSASSTGSWTPPASALIPSYAQITEALRRRRVGADAGDRFIEQLLGLELTPATCDRGETFVAGIIERAGVQGLEPLWSDPKALPTPAEIDAPGLWLARIELPTE